MVGGWLPCRLRAARSGVRTERLRLSFPFACSVWEQAFVCRGSSKCDEGTRKLLLLLLLLRIVYELGSENRKSKVQEFALAGGLGEGISVLIVCLL